VTGEKSFSLALAFSAVRLGSASFAHRRFQPDQGAHARTRP